MALVLADRVKETSTTTGTGTYTLAGAVSGFETFGSIGNGNTTYYACTLGADFEVGIGTYTSSGTTLARTTILQSSNSDNAVSWGSGTKTLFCTQPAEKAVFRDASGDVSITGDLTLTSTDDGSASDPEFILLRNSPSPADNDALGKFVFKGKNDAAEQVQYGSILNRIVDATDGTEDGSFELQTISGGSVATNLRIDASSSVGIRLLNGGEKNIRFDTGTSFNDNHIDLTPASATGARTVTLPDQTGTAMVALFYDSFASTEQDLSGSTYVTVDFDTNRQNSDTAVFSESAGEVTIAKAGVYMLSYEVTLGNKSSSRTEGLIRMSRKPSGGSYSEIAGSLSATYNRNSSTDVTTGSASVMFTVTAGDVFKVEAKRNSGSGGLVVFANGCRFNIMALKIG